MNDSTPTERANHAMRRIMTVLGGEMGFTERGNDKAYLDIIRAELTPELIMMHSALTAFFAKYPTTDPLLGMELWTPFDDIVAGVDEDAAHGG